MRGAKSADEMGLVDPTDFDPEAELSLTQSKVGVFNAIVNKAVVATLTVMNLMMMMGGAAAIFVRCCRRDHKKGCVPPGAAPPTKGGRTLIWPTQTTTPINDAKKRHYRRRFLSRWREADGPAGELRVNSENSFKRNHQAGIV